MHEDIFVTADPRTWFIEEPRARLLQSRRRRPQVRNLDGYVVQSFAALRNKFGDDGARLGWLEQFDPGAADGKHRYVDLVQIDCLAMVDTHAELAFIKKQRLLYRLDRN